MKTLFALPAILLLATRAAAWEVEAPVPLPKAVGTMPPAITLPQVSIDIRGGFITQRYLLRNAANTEASNVFTIYTPLFSWQGVAADYPDRHFPDLEVTSSSPLRHRRFSATAVHYGRDISSDVKRSGLMPTQVGLGEEGLVAAGDSIPRRFRNLVARGALVPAGGMLMPRWLLQASHSWEQSYSANGETELVLRYRARPGFTPMEKTAPQLAGLLFAHCGTAEDLAAIASGQSFSDSTDVLVETYRIPVGLGGMTPNKIRLDFAPSLPVAGEKRSFACGGPEANAVARGTPVIAGQELASDNGEISILTITGR